MSSFHCRFERKRFFAFLKYYQNDLEQLYSYHAEFFSC